MQHPKFQIFQDASGEYRFRLTDRTGEVVLTSAESYTSKLYCLSTVEFIKAHSPYDNCYTRKITAEGHYFFSFRESSGQSLGMSQLYTDYFSRENGISTVKSNAPFATMEDLTEVFSEGVLQAPVHN